jgi:hypothetical protein
MSICWNVFDEALAMQSNGAMRLHLDAIFLGVL